MRNHARTSQSSSLGEQNNGKTSLKLEVDCRNLLQVDEHHALPLTLVRPVEDASAVMILGLSEVS